jgi:hypothetical protein
MKAHPIALKMAEKAVENYLKRSPTWLKDFIESKEKVKVAFKEPGPSFFKAISYCERTHDNFARDFEEWKKNIPTSCQYCGSPIARNEGRRVGRLAWCWGCYPRRKR